MHKPSEKPSKSIEQSQSFKGELKGNSLANVSPLDTCNEATASISNDDELDKQAEQDSDAHNQGMLHHGTSRGHEELRKGKGNISGSPGVVRGSEILNQTSFEQLKNALSRPFDGGTSRESPPPSVTVTPRQHSFMDFYYGNSEHTREPSFSQYSGYSSSEMSGISTPSFYHEVSTTHDQSIPAVKGRRRSSSRCPNRAVLLEVSSPKDKIERASTLRASRSRRTSDRSSPRRRNFLSPEPDNAFASESQPSAQGLFRTIEGLVAEKGAMLGKEFFDFWTGTPTAPEASKKHKKRRKSSRKLETLNEIRERHEFLQQQSRQHFDAVAKRVSLTCVSIKSSLSLDALEDQCFENRHLQYLLSDTSIVQSKKQFDSFNIDTLSDKQMPKMISESIASVEMSTVWTAVSLSDLCPFIEVSATSEIPNYELESTAFYALSQQDQTRVNPLLPIDDLLTLNYQK